MANIDQHTRLLANGKRVIPNTLFQAAFNLVAALVSGQTTTNRFSQIALLDTAGEVIASKAAVFSFTPILPGPGTTVTGSAAFIGGEVTEDVHALQLRDVNGVPLAQADLDPPLPASFSINVTRDDVFTSGSI